MASSNRRLQYTYSGKHVNIFDLQPSDISIVDIAHALSMICRFGGHCSFHYSVAQHSIICAQRAYALTHDAEQGLRALLHDANEAYLGDIVRPLKLLPPFEFFRNAENAVQRLIYQKFELPTTLLEDDPALTAIDNTLLLFECEQVFFPGWTPEGYNLHSDHDAVRDWYVEILNWTPGQAEQTFHETFQFFNQQLQVIRHARKTFPGGSDASV